MWADTSPSQETPNPKHRVAAHHLRLGLYTESFRLLFAFFSKTASSARQGTVQVFLPRLRIPFFAMRVQTQLTFPSTSHALQPLLPTPDDASAELQAAALATFQLASLVIVLTPIIAGDGGGGDDVIAAGAGAGAVRLLFAAKNTADGADGARVAIDGDTQRRAGRGRCRRAVVQATVPEEVGLLALQHERVGVGVWVGGTVACCALRVGVRGLARLVRGVEALEAGLVDAVAGRARRVGSRQRRAAGVARWRGSMLRG